MGLNPFWLSWCYSLQISNGDGEGHAGGTKRRGKVYGKRSRGHKLLRRQSPKLPIVPLQRTSTQCAVTSSEGEQLWTQSIIGVIIRALVCKRYHPIDLGLLVALAIIDLSKPYFLIVGGFLRSRPRGQRCFTGTLLIIHNVFILKRG